MSADYTELFIKLLQVMKCDSKWTLQNKVRKQKSKVVGEFQFM